MTQRIRSDANVVVPAPGRIPLAGHLFRLRKGMLAYLDSLPQDTGVVRIDIAPWLKPVLVCDPDLIHHVHLDSETFDRGGPLIDKFVEVVGNGLGTCPMSDHRRQRRLLQPLFRADHLVSYAMMMTRQTEELVNNWRDGQIIDVPAQMNDYTGRLLIKSLFVADFARPAVEAMVRWGPVIRRGSYTRVFVPSPLLGIFSTLPVPGGREFARAHAQVRTAIVDTIRKYRRSTTDHGDLLSMLLAARDDDGPIDDEEIYDQVVSFMIAGFDTTGALLSWALDLLARHPAVHERLHAEVDTVLAGSVAGWDDLPNLDLTQRIVQETLRLRPPAWLLDRYVVHDTELGEHFLPAGTSVLYSPYFVHHSNAYFSDPERFDPDRWLPERKQDVARNAFIPFGAGPRKCIGDTFATTASIIALASIAARWHVESIDEVPPRPSAGLVYCPRALSMRLNRRRSP